jgi:hypothetical protein
VLFAAIVLDESEPSQGCLSSNKKGGTEMEKTLEGTSHMTGRITSNSIGRGLGWGAMGGLAGTLTMDLVLMGVLSAFGSPALTCFSIVGSTVARFLSMQSVEATRAIQLGVATHYIVGPVIGAIYGVMVARIKGLRVHTLKKSLLAAILYVEILSQPLLATTPILLKMAAPATLLWYGGSFLMHMIAGVVLGAVVGRGLPLAPLIQRRAQ